MLDVFDPVREFVGDPEPLPKVAAELETEGEEVRALIARMQAEEEETPAAPLGGGEQRGRWHNGEEHIRGRTARNCRGNRLARRVLPFRGPMPGQPDAPERLRKRKAKIPGAVVEVGIVD